MKYKTKVFCYEVLEVLQKIAFYFIPYTIILLVILFCLLVGILKVFPNPVDDISIAFGSALLGTIIGGLLSFLITLDSRDRDRINTVFLEKKNLIYKPLYNNFRDITSSQKNAFPRNYFYYSKEWENIKNSDIILSVPKYIKNYLLQYNDLIKKFSDNEKLLLDYFKDIRNNILTKYDSLKLNEDQIFSICIEYIEKKNSRTILTDRYLNPIEDTIKDEIFHCIIGEIESSEILLTCKFNEQKLILLSTEIFQMFEYILKKINARFDDKIIAI